MNETTPNYAMLSDNILTEEEWAFGTKPNKNENKNKWKKI